MSQNIDQIYIANPATTLATSDLFYLGRSPYGAGNDMAATWGTISGYIPGSVTTVVTGTSATLVGNQTFIANNAGLVTLALPATCVVGQVIRIVGLGAGGWSVSQAAGQVIHVSGTATTVGVGGSIASTNRYDTLEIECIIANTTFSATSIVSAGLTIV